MSGVSVYEAKSLASVFTDNLSAPILDTPKRGQWLNHIAKECGFRDWNAMVRVAAPQAPDLRCGDWNSLFVAAAWVEEPNRAYFRMVTTREREVAHLENGWPQRLADALGGVSNFQACSMSYGREDGLITLDDVWPAPRVFTGNEVRTPQRVRIPPALAVDMHSGSRIAVWFIEARYTAAEDLRLKQFVPHYRFEAAFQTWGPDAPVDQFLSRLTGQTRPRRTCLYVPEVPNSGNDGHVPVITTEGERGGVVVGDWPALAYEEAFARVMATNRQAGISVTDMHDIASQYRIYEPREEDWTEFSGIYDD